MKGKAITYSIVNSGIINLFWSFFVVLGLKLGSQHSDFFNDTIQPAFINLFGIIFLSGLLLSLIGSFNLSLNEVWPRKVLLWGIWITIIQPSLPILLTLLMFIFGKGDIGNLVSIVICIAVSGLNFGLGKPILKELK